MAEDTVIWSWVTIAVCDIFFLRLTIPRSKVTFQLFYLQDSVSHKKGDGGGAYIVKNGSPMGCSNIA